MSSFRPSRPKDDQRQDDQTHDDKHHLWGTNGEGVPATFIPGTTGGVVLVDPNEFHYTRDNTTPSGKTYWKCRRYGQHVLGQHKCKATALTEGKTLLRTSGKHVHKEIKWGTIRGKRKEGATEAYDRKGRRLFYDRNVIKRYQKLT